MKNFMIVLTIVSLMAIVGCSKSSNPVGSQDDTKTNTIPDLVITGTNVFPPLPDGAVLQKNMIHVAFLIGKTDFQFDMPSGATRTFTGDSAKAYIGQSLHIMPKVSVTLNGVEQVIFSNPQMVSIDSAQAAPKVNQGTFDIVLK